MTFHPITLAPGAEVKAPTLLLPLQVGRGSRLLQSHRFQRSALVSGLPGTQCHFQHCFCRRMPSELQAIHSFFCLFSKLARAATGARPELGTGAVRRDLHAVLILQSLGPLRRNGIQTFRMDNEMTLKTEGVRQSWRQDCQVHSQGEGEGEAGAERMIQGSEATARGGANHSELLERRGALGQNCFGLLAGSGHLARSSC